MTTIAIPYPTEFPPDSTRVVLRSAEERWAFRLCLASPVIAIVAWGLAARYLMTAVYLKPPSADFHLLEAVRWKPAIAVGLAAFCLPWCWWTTLKWSRRLDQTPVAAVLAVVLVIAANLLLSHPRATWFFTEWALVRTPNPSFARNTLMWEQRNFERTMPQNKSAPLVRLVGSSQMYHGTDLTILSGQAARVVWEKNCLAGFGPLQYSWLEHVLLSPKPQIVVCFVSEFDFFREDSLPVSRLEWSATGSGLQRLQAELTDPVVDLPSRVEPLRTGANWPESVHDQWSLRGDLVHLSLAAALPVWRQRDHFRRVCFHYWQNRSRPAVDGPQLAQSAGMDTAQQSLQQNVGRKRFVETNFRAFARFAQDLWAAGVELLVCEGTTHPQATRVYDPELRRETRERLRSMSKEIGFRYLDETALPRFKESDFADPYHLNSTGRTRFSRFLADVVSEQLKTFQQVQ